MIAINKSAEPPSLTTYKRMQNADFDSMPKKEKNYLQNSLLSEQHNLCAYCMRKIDINKMTIEHFKCKTKHPNLQLDYKNLLACCDDGQTCNKKKGDRDLLFNPSNASDFAQMQIFYRVDGTICSQNHTFEGQLNEVLNLNAGFLKQNRKQVIERIKERLNANAGTRTKNQIQRFLDGYKKNGVEYCGAAIWYLEKKLKQAK